MNLNDTINQIIDIPRRFYELKNISIYSLLEESGYFNVQQQINEANILVAIINNPRTVESWMRLSENKRIASGWYIADSGDDRYIVGYYPENEFDAIKYQNANEACAAFIIKELEGWDRNENPLP